MQKYSNWNDMPQAIHAYFNDEHVNNNNEKKLILLHT